MPELVHPSRGGPETARLIASTSGVPKGRRPQSGRSSAATGSFPIGISRSSRLGIRSVYFDASSTVRFRSSLQTSDPCWSHGSTRIPTDTDPADRRSMRSGRHGSDAGARTGSSIWTSRPSSTRFRTICSCGRCASTRVSSAAAETPAARANPRSAIRSRAQESMCIRKYRPGGTDGAPIFAA